MIKLVIFALSLTFSCFTFAHGRWLVPSHTVVSGDQAAFVSLDMSISNDVFHADKPYGGVPPQTAKNGGVKSLANPSKAQPFMAGIAQSTQLWLSYPDGSQTNDTPIVNLGRKSAAAVKLQQNGTYRFDVKQDPIYYTVYTQEGGKRGRVFGIDERATANLPQGAKLAYKVKLINWVHAYVTRNETSQTHAKANNRGLELIFKTHPNDLFVGEALHFTALFEGKPLQDSEIKITRGNTRYRNKRQLQTLRTDTKGQAQIIWQQAGMYVLELAAEKQVKGEAYDKLKHALYLSLEVFPE
ncbi:MAG: DUF4198 domain-containing protein [Cellvibrionaceae bacterium]|nr:DUF4198 domain-containing protein [Cellvibrionaceae bacterium]